MLEILGKLGVPHKQNQIGPQGIIFIFSDDMGWIPPGQIKWIVFLYRHMYRSVSTPPPDSIAWF